jgi:hypothetical protein
VIIQQPIMVFGGLRGFDGVTLCFVPHMWCHNSVQRTFGTQLRAQMHVLFVRTYFQPGVECLTCQSAWRGTCKLSMYVGVLYMQVLPSHSMAWCSAAGNTSLLFRVSAGTDDPPPFHRLQLTLTALFIRRCCRSR